MTDHQRIQIPALSVRDRLGIRPEAITRDATAAPVTPAAPEGGNPLARGGIVTAHNPVIADDLGRTAAMIHQHAREIRQAP